MILENIAKVIEGSGKSRYQISKDTGIDNAVLCRIVSGGSCSIETADILCKYLKIELKKKKFTKEILIMAGKKRPEAMKMQQGISGRLKRLKKNGTLKDEDYNYLWDKTHKLYELGLKTEKLKKIQEIINE